MGLTRCYKTAVFLHFINKKQAADIVEALTK